MVEGTYQIEKFGCTEDAFFNAFSFLHRQNRPEEKEGDYHFSFSKKHYELEKTNPSDTIEVATFIRHKKGTSHDKNRVNYKRREYYYVCEFKWQPYRRIKEIKNMDEITCEGSETIKTDYLLFFIKWNSDFSCWERFPILACSNASSHHEAADWMLKEITAKGSEVCDSENFWRDGIFSCFSETVINQTCSIRRKSTRNDLIWCYVRGGSFFLLLAFPTILKENIFWGIFTAVFCGWMMYYTRRHPNWKGYPWT